MPVSPKPAVQKRARQTRERLLSALETLLKDREFEQIAVSDIAAQAGVSVGSVYSHFADKEAFLEALLDTWRGRVEARLEEISQSDIEAELRGYGGLRQALRVTVGEGLSQVEEDRHIIRATYNHLRLKSDADWMEWDHLQRQAYDTVAAILEVFQDEIIRTDTEKMTLMLNYSLNVLLGERVIYRERGPFGAMALSDEDFVCEVADMAYAYLTAPEPTSR